VSPGSVPIFQEMDSPVLEHDRSILRRLMRIQWCARAPDWRGRTKEKLSNVSSIHCLTYRFRIGPPLVQCALFGNTFKATNSNRGLWSLQPEVALALASVE
jgi:hypothetical protein